MRPCLRARKWKRADKVYRRGRCAATERSKGKAAAQPVYLRFSSPRGTPPGPDMTTIRQEDLIQSVADALQYISYYHPRDYIRHLARAYERERSPAAKDAIAQILTNSRMCAEGHRPVCQDTGIVNVFLKSGTDARFQAFTRPVAHPVTQP